MNISTNPNLPRAWACAALLLACSEPSTHPQPAGATGGATSDAADGGSSGSSGSSGTLGMAGVGGAGIEADGGDSGSGAGGSSVDAGGMNGGVSGSAGESPSEEACTRELLASLVEDYFAALAARDPSRLPLAADVRFTENGVELALGAGLWQGAGMVRYKHSALDTELCSSVSEAVVPEGSTDLPVGVRLKVEGASITEIETIVARPGDYVLFGSPFESDPEAIIASASLGWDEPVAEGDRASREEIVGWITRYFERFPSGGCDFASSCVRIENGGGSFPCTLGASCAQSSSGAFGGPLVTRLVVADETTGVGVGFTMFMGHTDLHMIMLRGGEVRAVHTVLSAASSSGWD